MNTETRFHSREHYETVLTKLLDQAGRQPVGMSEISNVELLVQINNLLIYFDAEPYSLDEIESIVKAIDSGMIKKRGELVQELNKVYETIDQLEEKKVNATTESRVFNVDESGNWLTKEKRQALKKSIRV